MKISIAISRIFFVILCLFFMSAFMITLPIGPLWQRVLIGLGVGTLFSLLLFGVETLLSRYNLRAFNTLILGLFLGYLMGKALVVICNAVLDLSHLGVILQPQTTDMIKVFFFILGTYLGTCLTIRFSDEFLLSIPFIKLPPERSKKKDLLIDSSALSDSRILDLATTGLVNNLLVIPRFIIKEIYSQAEFGEEILKNKAKHAIENLKKLQELPHLELRLNETHFQGGGDSFSQLVRLANLIDANILTADVSQVQIPAIEGVIIINLHSLSNALKPLMQAGESIKIKIQRYGKEPNQGVGYLEDGTMVVINGGGDYIGENIDVQVLSVKHTSSGRMVFTNAMDHIPSKGNQLEV